MEAEISRQVVHVNLRRLNLRRLRSSLKPQYDFIVCGSGPSGQWWPRRLAENPDVNVLLLEAGGDDDVPSVTPAHRWFETLRLSAIGSS